MWIELIDRPDSQQDQDCSQIEEYSVSRDFEELQVDSNRAFKRVNWNVRETSYPRSTLNFNNF